MRLDAHPHEVIAAEFLGLSVGPGVVLGEVRGKQALGVRSVHGGVALFGAVLKRKG